MKWRNVAVTAAAVSVALAAAAGVFRDPDAALAVLAAVLKLFGS